MLRCEFLKNMMLKRAKKLFKLTFILSVFIFFASIGVKFYLCNSVTVSNDQLEQALVKRSNIQEDMEILNVQRASLSSISYLEKRAKELGFVEMENNVISLDLDAPTQVALVNSR